MRHGADVVITARNEGEITAAAQAVTAGHAGRRARSPRGTPRDRRRRDRQ
jgi:hypothetical protein